MAAVKILSVNVLDNPASFTSPLAFEVEYECISALKDDLEWKITYVGSAESEKYDQVLDSVLVGPVAVGHYKFRFEADAPSPEKIPADDIVGVTVLLLTCAYNQKEFIRVGYYVNVQYTDEELRENPPDSPIIEKLQRNILAEHPRVTNFPIDFDEEVEEAKEEGQQPMEVA